MSREGITDELARRNISIVHLVYSQQYISVYEGRYRQSPAAIKVQYSDASNNLSDLEKELRSMQQLSHANILQIYDCFCVTKNSASYVVFVSEQYAKNFQKDVIQRRDNQYPWKEEELWKVAYNLVEVLAYLQKKGIAHRNIKPASILMGPYQEVRIKHIGPFLYTRGWRTTNTGILKYFSPGLEEQQRAQESLMQHDPFKSDVYSLGLTLYELASLQPPTVFFAPTLTQETTEQIVESLSYSANLKSLIKSMLIIDEEKRGDFLQFEVWMNPQPIPHSLPLQSSTENQSSNAPFYFTEARSSISLPPIQSYADDDRSLLRGPVAMNMPTKSEPRCMKCFKEVNRFADNAKFEVVQLTCNPQCHMFCSRTCFVSWGLQQPKSDPHCPKCGELIEPDVFQAYQINEETEADEKEKDPSTSRDRYGGVQRPVSAMTFDESETSAITVIVEGNQQRGQRSAFEWCWRICLCFQRKNRPEHSDSQIET